MNKDNEPKIALFIDYDNIAIGLREAGGQTFEINLILERILEKGRIIFKRAYADWYLFSDAKRKLHEYGIEMIDIPMRRNIGKNSADIRMVVDALDLCYTKEHIDTFIIGSGDSDFTPLVSKLKENNKEVIGFGLRMSTSNLLANNCDEFIFYEDLTSLPVNRPQMPSGLTKRQHDAFSFVLDAVAALVRESKDILWGSLIKDTIRRKRPSFSESQFGYSSFSQLLEDAARHGLIGLIKDPKSGGTPVVTGFGHVSESSPPSSSRSTAPAQPRGGSSLLVNTEASRSLPAIKASDVGEERTPGPLKRNATRTSDAKAAEKARVEEAKKEAKSEVVELTDATKSEVKEATPRKPSRRKPASKSTPRPKAEVKEEAPVVPEEKVEQKEAKGEEKGEAKATESKLVAKTPAKKPARRRAPAKPKSEVATLVPSEPVKDVKPVETKPAEAKAAPETPKPAVEKPEAKPVEVQKSDAAPVVKATEEERPKGKPLKSNARRRRR